MVHLLKIASILTLLIATSSQASLLKKRSECQVVTIPACTASWWHINPSPKSTTSHGHVFVGTNAVPTTLDKVVSTFTAAKGDVYARYFDVSFDDKKSLVLDYRWAEDTTKLRLPDAYITVIFIDDDGKDTKWRASYVLYETHILGDSRWCSKTLEGNPYHRFRVETSIRPLGNYACGIPPK